MDLRSGANATRRPRQRFTHGQRGKDIDQLKGARHAAPGEFDRTDARDIPPQEPDLSDGRPEKTGDNVDQGRFASPVGPTIETNSPSLTLNETLLSAM
jgi:hypothetical protein